MLLNCPFCEDAYDYDGFEEHGYETLYCCKCGIILDKKGNIIPKESVDLSGLEDRFRGLFVQASRRKK